MKKNVRMRAVTALLMAVCMLLGCLTASAVQAEQYTDIKDHWAYDDIKWTLEQEIFLGTTPTTFCPESGMTRAMFVTVLYRFAQKMSFDTQTGENVFTDVPNGAWYTDAVCWAYQHDVAQGVSDTLFAPEQLISREQVAKVLYRFMTMELLPFYGMTFSDSLTFADAQSVSEWAKEPLKALSDKRVKLIGGFEDHTFRPDQVMTRAQTAALLHRTYDYLNLCTADASGGVQISILPNTVKLLQEAALPRNASRILTASMAKNEAEGMQFVLRAYEDLTNVKCTVSDLVNENGEMLEKVELFRQRYVSIKSQYTSSSSVTAGKYPDALVPMFDGSDGGLDNTYCDVSQGNNQGYWITATAAKGQSAGVYTGTVTLTCDQFDAPVYIPMEVTVWDFEIPTKNSYTTAFALWYTEEYYYKNGNCTSSSEALDIKKMYYEFFLNYRITSTNIPYKDGAVTSSNLEDFMTVLKSYVDREEVNGYRVPLTVNNYSVYTLDNQNLLKSLDAAGLLEKAYLYDLDEPIASTTANGELNPDDANYERVRRYASNIKMLFATSFDRKEDWHEYSLPVIVTTACAAYEPYIKDWCPLWYCKTPFNKYDVGMLSETEIREKQANGSTVWWYGCVTPSRPYPTYHIQDDLMTARLVHWMQRDTGATGEIYWATTLWGVWGRTNAQVDYIIDIWNNPYTLWGHNVAGDGLLAYPGTVNDSYVGRNVPVPTIRLESIRDGFEDYEYLTMLEEKYQAILARLGLTGVSADDLMNTYYEAVYDADEYIAGGKYDRDNPSLMLRVREIMAQDIMRQDEDVLVSVKNYGSNAAKKIISVYADADAKVVVDGKILTGQQTDGCYVYQTVVTVSGSEPVEKQIYVNGEAYTRILTPFYGA